MDVDTDNTDQLTIQRIAGGSVIKRQPVFSAEGEILFVIWDNVVRAYSSQTGEWIRDLEGANAEIVNVQPDPANPKILYACTVEGQIISWKVKSGVVDKRSQLNSLGKERSVLAFHSVDLGDGRASALVAWHQSGGTVQLALYDLVLGDQLQLEFPFHMTRSPFHIDVANALNYVAIAQDNRLHVHTLRGNADHRTWRSAAKSSLTCVRTHPLEELCATGDDMGRIFVWRCLFGERGSQPNTRLYHWHHTTVNTLCFSETGSQFYSGGNESVLVRWHLGQSDQQRSFLPRVAGCPVHLAVSRDNQKIALATNDNGIQLLNSQFKPLAVVQNFTWVADDKTVAEKFPIGLRVNPRNSALMLNGRVGHLQFFSTHTRSLLYNLDTTGQNRLSLETAKVLYNTCITHAAISMDWLVTGELLDDQQTSVELRLKFWHFSAEKQTYVLNTQVELPHEGGLTALEFSSAYETENLMCATAGKDNVLKVWTLEASDNVNKKGKFWSCTGKTNYKNLPVQSLAFSADSSLLSVGYANTLCVYQAETLRLKCVLSCPAGLDGSVNKVTLNIAADPAAAEPKSASKAAKAASVKETKRTQLLEQRRKMLQAVKAYLTNDSDSDLVRTVTAKLTKLGGSRVSTASAQLTLREQELVHRKIMAHHELNFYQKLELFGRMSLHSLAPKELTAPFGAYMTEHLDGVQRLRLSLGSRAQTLAEPHRFGAGRKLFNYTKRVGSTRREFARVRDLISFGEAPIVAKSPARRRTDSEKGQDAKQKKVNGRRSSSAAIAAAAQQQLPVKSVAQIKHVCFGSGEFAHLVIVCTERRLLIWNLLTLRLQTALKLSVHRLTVDPYTSLVAAFTVHNELYVFLPNVPYTLYQRKNMPSIHGAAWIPRRYPKSHTLNLDWQASSQLFFLSTNQEILQLVSDSDLESLSSSAAYLQDGNAPLTYTPFGAMIAKQIHNATNAAAAAADRLPTGTLAMGRNGKSTVKEIIGLQAHTMAPVHLLCGSLLKSLAITTTASTSTDSADRLQTPTNGTNGSAANGSDSTTNDDDDIEMSRNGTADVDADDADDAEANDAVKRKLESRKLRMSQADALARKQKAAAEDTYQDHLSVERQLQKLAKRTIVLDF